MKIFLKILLRLLSDLNILQYTLYKRTTEEHVLVCDGIFVPDCVYAMCRSNLDGVVLWNPSELMLQVGLLSR